MTQGKRSEEPHEIVIFLRALLGEPDDQPTPDELAASIPRLLPPGPRRLHAAASLAWSLVGHRLFADEIPNMDRVRAEPMHVPITLAMLHTNNISAAARMLGTSRRALRDGLHRLGVYPWYRAWRDGRSKPAPGLTFALRELPDVVEDGTRGVVWFKLQGQTGVGPAWLERGDRSDRLFRGWWVDRETVETYARENGHDFHCEGEGSKSGGDK